jgi:hypothetical protein
MSAKKEKKEKEKMTAKAERIAAIFSTYEIDKMLYQWQEHKKMFDQNGKDNSDNKYYIQAIDFISILKKAKKIKKES